MAGYYYGVVISLWIGHYLAGFGSGLWAVAVVSGDLLLVEHVYTKHTLSYKTIYIYI